MIYQEFTGVNNALLVNLIPECAEREFIDSTDTSKMEQLFFGIKV